MIVAIIKMIMKGRSDGTPESLSKIDAEIKENLTGLRVKNVLKGLGIFLGITFIIMLVLGGVLFLYIK